MKFNNENEVIELIQSCKITPKWIEEARKEHRELKALVYGEEYKDLIIRIEHLEIEKRIIERRKYSKSIQGLNQRLLRTLDNVYAATGGNKDYRKIKNNSDYKKVLSKITKVRDNKSIEKWLQTYWLKDLFVVDPNGLIMLEYKADNINELKPTYKSIDNIRNYKSRGQLLDYVVFEPKKITIEQFIKKHGIIPQNIDSDKVFELIRVVDDLKEWYIINQNDNYMYVPEISFEHPFGMVPALTCSDKSRLGSEKKLSFINDIVLDQKEFLRDQSVLTLFKYKNGFPIPYMPKLICPTCKGTKKDGQNICPTCAGKGEIFTKDVVDEITLYIDLEAENPINLPANFAGYIVPPVEIWKQFREELDIQEQEQNYTLYGSHLIKQANETATGRFIDQQPVINSLNPISDTAQFMEKMLTEWIINFIIPLKPKDESYCTIQYGKRYILDSPDILFEKYQKAVTTGMNNIIKDRYLQEYITSKYKNDVTTLKTELLKKKHEPYVHETIDTILKVFNKTEAQKKILFNDFWEELDDPTLLTDVKIKEMLSKYFEENIKVDQQQSNQEQFQAINNN